MINDERDIPKVTGKDAEKFIKKSLKNQINVTVIHDNGNKEKGKIVEIVNNTVFVRMDSDKIVLPFKKVSISYK